MNRMGEDKCRHINIMNAVGEKDEIVDPEAVAEQFWKHEELKLKLKQLQAPVFKNFTIKKSKSVLHQCHSENPHEATLKAAETAQVPLKIQNMRNVTTISFASSRARQPEQQKAGQSARSLPSFSPLRSKLNFRKSATYMEQKIVEPAAGRLRQSLSERIKEKRSSQTLLRKNALFLVSSLKTRYRQIQRRAHIGDTQGVANVRLGHFNEKTAAVTHYQQRFQYMEEAKQRLLLAKFQGRTQQNRASPLLPEPW